MNNIESIITDVGVLKKEEVVGTLDSALMFIDTEEYFKARDVLEPLLAKVKRVRAFVSAIPLKRAAGELPMLTMLDDSFSYLLGSVEHAIDGQIMRNQDIAERLREKGYVG
jgi:hypothetical protein